MKKESGLSLIEMMIGIVLGLIVVASVGRFYMSTLRSNLDNAKKHRFDQTVQILKNTMAAGIRRSGFSNATTKLANVPGWTPDMHYYTNGTCALFTYVDTTLSTPKQQYFGYKLDTATGIMYAYQSDNKVDCSQTTVWEAITNPDQIIIREATPGTLFTSPSNPKLVYIHFIAEATGLKTGATPVRRESTTKIFLRNS